jgi:hypothetical protein
VLRSSVFAESHPRRSPDSLLALTTIPRLLSPHSDILSVALSPCSAILLNPLECALADEHRVLPVFGRNRPYLSPLECALVRHLISVDSKQLTGTLNPLDATLTKNTGVPPSSQISFSPSGFPTFRPVPNYPLSFHTLAHSFAPTEITTHLFSRGFALFAKNTRGWGYPRRSGLAAWPGDWRSERWESQRESGRGSVSLVETVWGRQGKVAEWVV